MVLMIMYAIKQTSNALRTCSGAIVLLSSLLHTSFDSDEIRLMNSAGGRTTDIIREVQFKYKVKHKFIHKQHRKHELKTTTAYAQNPMYLQQSWLNVRLHRVHQENSHCNS